jgi:hypothetical protein
LYEYSLSDPLNYEDASGLRVGDPYGTPEEAGIAALEEYGGYSNSLGREIGGLIYQNNGSYSYSSGVLGTSGGTQPGLAPIPAGAKIVADWHTHVKQSNPRNRFARQEWCGVVQQPFSRPPQNPSDLSGAWADHRVFIMVGTPSGHIGIYFPHPGGSFEWYIYQPSILQGGSPVDPVIEAGKQ